MVDSGIKSAGLQVHCWEDINSIIDHRIVTNKKITIKNIFKKKGIKTSQNLDQRNSSMSRHLPDIRTTQVPSTTYDPLSPIRSDT